MNITEDLRKRLMTAGGLVAVLVLCLLLAAFTEGGWFGLTLIAFLLAGIAASEFAGVCTGGGSSRFDLLCYFVLPCVPISAVLYMLSGAQLPSGAGAILARGAGAAAGGFFWAMLLGLLFLVARGHEALPRAASAAQDLFIGIFMIGFCGSALMVLTAVPQGYAILLWLLLVVCLNDTAAYFTGRRIGGPRLAPVLSPNKTISGSVGGFAAGMIVGALCAPLIGSGILHAALLALLVVAAAQIGDLAKSYLKRLHGVKDTGSLLPGHGGVLDRADGTLLAAPVLFFWLLRYAG